MIKSGNKRQMIFYAFLIFALTQGFYETAGGAAQPDGEEIKFISPNASNLQILKVMPLSSHPSREGVVFVIGDYALSKFAKSLTNLSREGQKPRLVDEGEFTALHSSMGFAFPKREIPIKLLKYESLFQKSLNDWEDPDLNYFPEVQPILPLNDIDDGNEESSGGVTVIWKP